MEEDEKSILFNKNDKELIAFAYKTRNMNVSDTVNSEMMRRLNISIKKFNRESSKYSKRIIWLTYVMIVGLVIQIGLALFLHS